MSWLKKLTSGLSKSSSKLSGGISTIFTKRRLDDDMLEELEELLITTDIGASTATNIVANFARQRFDKEIEAGEVRAALANEISDILEPVAIPLDTNKSHKPQVILMVGVNGNGKTTTIGKLAMQCKKNGKTVMLAACDTFRAAATEQLAVWAERAGCTIVTGKPQSDTASVAFASLERARAENVDILLIDTAGRLQNKSDLMEELLKITRVLKKLDPDAPHDCILVLDATTGQNAHSQVKSFKEIVDISGLIVTKLDGTAKGGVVVALADNFKLPIHAIGVGEGIEDMQKFSADDFAKSLTGCIE